MEVELQFEKRDVYFKKGLPVENKESGAIHLTAKSPASSASFLLQLPLYPSQTNSTDLSPGVLKSIAFW